MSRDSGPAKSFWYRVRPARSAPSPGIVGGLLLEHAGAASFPWAVLVLAAIALCITSIARRHAFKPGPRVHA